jgi:hypothetical protein
VDLPLYPGDEVKTGADGKVEIQYNDGHIIRLAENTRVKLNDRGKGPGLLVSLGRIWSRFKKMTGPSKFEIETPTVVAGIRGTIVLAEVNEDGVADVSVQEGEVELRVKHLAQVVHLRRMQRCRLGRRSQRPEVMAFGPKRGPQWYHWTDEVVRQTCAGMKERLGTCSQALEARFREAKQLHDALDQKVQGVTKAPLALIRIDQEITRLGERVARPGRQPLSTQELSQQADRLAQGLDHLGDILDGIHADLDAHGQQVEQLRRQVASLVQNEMALRRGLDKLRSRREFDPHWQQLKPGYDEAAEVGRRARTHGDEVVRLLDPAQSGKARALFGCQRRLGFVTQRVEHLRRAVGVERDRLKRIRAGQPPGPSPGWGQQGPTQRWKGARPPGPGRRSPQMRGEGAGQRGLRNVRHRTR